MKIRYILLLFGYLFAYMNLQECGKAMDRCDDHLAQIEYWESYNND